MRDKSGGMTVQSSIGEYRLDNSGAAIGAARMDPAKAYGAIPLLLQEYINTGSEDAWQEIRGRIDNIYLTVSSAMEALDSEEPFSAEVKKLLESGKKLFFKPNLVWLPAIDPKTHGPVLTGTCLPWEFLAALMRWFHDERDISYHQMAVGEAGTTTPVNAFTATRALGTGKVTAQAIMEGKWGDNYGGWGFYFARKYLAECHDSQHEDDPMSGYEESISGVCLPPGKVSDKLLIYDLNKIEPVPISELQTPNSKPVMSTGREVPVPDGINYSKITIHKAVIGGDPDDPEDRGNWPGCVLVNAAKLKIHVLELFTCAIKNLGIGLYPMEANDSREPGKFRWKYALPNVQIPLFKMAIPHSRWVVQYDEDSLTPLRHKDSSYVWRKTGGMEANMADIIKAVKGQGIKMLHVVDAIEAVNIHHSGPGCTPVPEGLVFASQDIVAVDACGSRYLFSMAYLDEVEKIRREHHLTSDVIQKVPMPRIEGKNIVNGRGYDSAFSRYHALQHCEERGLGRTEFYVTGTDLWQGGRLASLKQHLGLVEGSRFIELLTDTMYHTPNKPLWDLQATCFEYLELNDQLTGADFKRQVLAAFDEDGDGIIDYLETGRGDSPVIMTYGAALMTQELDPWLAMEFRFLISAMQLKRLKRDWNIEGHNLGEQALLGQAVAMAFSMSNSAKEMPDPLFPGRTWGKGKWPSMQYVTQRQLCARIYGQAFPERFDATMSPYGCAFRYADSTCNKAGYCKNEAGSEDVIGNYHRAVEQGAALLPFTFYVPRGLGSVGSALVPNMVETDDPQLMFTAIFQGQTDRKAWRDFKPADFKLK